MFKDILIFLVAWILLLYGLSYIKSTADADRVAACKGHIIISVGGCDWGGSCGVTLDDMSYAVVYKPAVGQGCK